MPRGLKNRMSRASHVIGRRYELLILYPQDYSVFKVDRSGNRVVVPVMVPKDTSWQEKIVELCIDSLESGNIPDPEVKISITDI